MPSQPLDTGWAFSTVYDLLGSDCHEVGSPNLQRGTNTSSPPAGGGLSLGNFDKLYETLGWPEPGSTASLPPLDESELSNSDDVLFSPVLEASQKAVNQAVHRTPDVEVLLTSRLTKKQRRKARRAAEKALQKQAAKPDGSEHESQREDAIPQLSATEPITLTMTRSRSPKKVDAQSHANARAASPTKNSVSDDAQIPPTPVKQQRPVIHKRSKSSKANILPETPKQKPISETAAPATIGVVQYQVPVTPLPFQQNSLAQFKQSQTPTTAVQFNHSLVPRTVRPATVPRNSHSGVAESQMLAPATPTSVLLPPYSTPQPTVIIRSQVDRHFNLFNKLLTRFADDRKWLVAPRQLVNENTKADGIHIFFDASNILIGFMDMLRSYGIQPFDISFDSLALLMERRRPVAKRVFVGSHREANPLPQVRKLVDLAKAVGYECNVQEQVYIVREESEKKKFFNDVKRVGWYKATQIRSGSGSDSETNTAPTKTRTTPKWVEQGVDELLHLKMCQSIIDTEQPTTMVLGTGDGAEAEMSDGFLAHVERAMRKGWKVELITWRQQTNGGYKRKTFRQKWGEQFTIIELDDFLEDLIDTP